MIPKLSRMFTGIVQTTGQIAAATSVPGGLRLTINVSHWEPEGGYVVEPGHSICVSGVCLTVTRAEHDGLAFDVIRETLDKTTLGGLAVGDRVNIEPAVLPGQPLGGHFMQGHVDGVGAVTAIHAGEDEWRITVAPPAELMAYIIPKGSVAIDGVSLTLAEVHDDTFEVALIPTTLDITTLGQQKVGDHVNLEADILAKSVVTVLKRMQSGGETPEVTMDLLRRAGFTG